jgi:hypothetical protein
VKTNFKTAFSSLFNFLFQAPQNGEISKENGIPEGGFINKEHFLLESLSI